jgi:ABC-type uncharacterized transport system auxiliary subunit
LIFQGWLLPLRTKSKPTTMKKVLAILAIAAVFTACNNEATVDTEKMKADSIAREDSIKQAADAAMKAIDSTANAAKDTIQAKVDTAKKKM